MDVDRSTSDTRTIQRPPSVTLLAWLQLLQSLALFGFGVYLFFNRGLVTLATGLLPQFIPLALYHSMISSVFLIALGLAGIVTSIALLGLRSWSWTLSMAIQGLGLFGGLVEYWRQNPLYLGLIVGVLMVLLLNQREVKITFDRLPPPDHVTTGDSFPDG